MINFLKRHQAGCLIAFVLFVLLVAVAINYIPAMYNFEKSCAVNEINDWFYFWSGVGTACLAIIAYYKIGEINKQNLDNFLLHIDERWGSPEIIKAREIIHTHYRNIQDEYKTHLDFLPEKKCEQKDTKKQKSAQKVVDTLYLEHRDKINHLIIPEIITKDDFIQAIMGIEIIELSCNTASVRDFMYLLNFLDFMETIGYIVKNNEALAVEVDDFFGTSLIFNYRIFNPYIIYKRQKHNRGERTFYSYFEELYDQLKLYDEHKKAFKKS